MKSFLFRNVLYLMTALGLVVGIVTAMSWSTMSVPQRIDGVFFCVLILHLWEESVFPGGFTDMITRNLHFTQADPHFGEIVTSALVLLIAFVPLFLLSVSFVAMVPLLLGILETLAHLAAIRMSDRRFYSPGLMTAIVLMLPLSIYGITYTVQNNLLQPVQWLFCLVYMLAALMIAQQIVVRASGMKYSEFLKNARAALLGK